jgi:hypothetical protein
LAIAWDPTFWGCFFLGAMAKAKVTGISKATVKEIWASDGNDKAFT